AGLILPWVQEREESSSDLNSGFVPSTPSTGSQASPAGTETPGREQKPENCRSVLKLRSIVGGGSASPPVSNAVGSTSLMPAALATVSLDANAFAVSYSRWRERSLQLPQPPLGELLDPPKTA